MKAHLKISNSPISSKSPVLAECGAEVKNPVFAIELDTAFTVGHKVAEILSINTLLFCKRCISSTTHGLEGQYIYVLHEGQEARDETQSE
jgi:hypothetical protein